MRIERSFIQFDGIGERTERTLWADGVTDWRQDVAPDTLGPSRRAAVRRGASEAEAALDRGDARYFDDRLPSAERWRLLESFRDNLVALDIETTGLDRHRDVPTTVSVHGRGRTDTFVRGIDLTADALRAAIPPGSILVTFNGARFDLPFLRTQLGIDLELPHVDLLYPTRRLGWRGGLKSIEDQLGIDRELPDVDGREAVRLWHQYQSGRDDALDRLISYNVEDTRNLLDLADRAVTALDEAVLDPYR